MLEIVILGSGYVGLVAAVGFAKIGHNVVCCDIDEARIEKLKNGDVPIYEPCLSEMALEAQSNGNLLFSADSAVYLPRAQIVIIAVGTPTDRSGEQGKVDKTALLGAVKHIEASCKNGVTVMVKSTVPPGTCAMLSEKLRSKNITVVSNPEFLREGKAIEDFMNPQRILIGLEEIGSSSEQLMRELYGILAEDNEFIVTSLASAELAKYACNAILAVRLSYINEVADLCRATAADWESVQAVLASDSRIGRDYLQAGAGYGGSCLPKDTRALLHEAETLGVSMPTLRGAVDSNERRKKDIIERVKRYIGSPSGKRIALLGLSFKADSDDIREAPAVQLAEALLSEGIDLIMHDPKAIGNARSFLQGGAYASSIADALRGADAVIVMTEWAEYKNLTVRDFGLMRGDIIIDFRNLYTGTEIAQGSFSYFSLDLES